MTLLLALALQAPVLREFATGLLLLVALAVLWVMGGRVSLGAPFTAAKIIDALFFLALLVWFILTVIGLVH